MNNALYNVIETRYRFALPEEYRSLEVQGLLTLSAPAPDHFSAFYEPGTYLWLNDMEWYSLQEIADFEFKPYHLAGLVPFAFTGRGDYWCWQPAQTDYRGTRVLCCYHDEEFATVYAPNFHTALYRQILDFCSWSAEEGEVDASPFLNRWAIDLAGIFPILWCKRLLYLADAPMRSAEVLSIEQIDVAFEDMDTEILWMQPAKGVLHKYI